MSEARSEGGGGSKAVVYFFGALGHDVRAEQREEVGRTHSEVPRAASCGRSPSASRPLACVCSFPLLSRPTKTTVATGRSPLP
jgi:hypothetical protein